MGMTESNYRRRRGCVAPCASLKAAVIAGDGRLPAHGASATTSTTDMSGLGKLTERVVAWTIHPQGALAQAAAAMVGWPRSQLRWSALGSIVAALSTRGRCLADLPVFRHDTVEEVLCAS